MLMDKIVSVYEQLSGQSLDSLTQDKKQFIDILDFKAYKLHDPNTDFSQILQSLKQNFEIANGLITNNLKSVNGSVKQSKTPKNEND